VDASHQSLRPVAGATVLTCYRSLGIDPVQRLALYNQPWTQWRDSLLEELALAHADLRAKVTHLDVMRYGHGMAVPVPGIHTSAALSALQQGKVETTGRLHFAHGDLSGYSVFEEAFTHGHRAGRAVH
jgi:hypothetical protein